MVYQYWVVSAALLATCSRWQNEGILFSFNERPGKEFHFPLIGGPIPPPIIVLYTIMTPSNRGKYWEEFFDQYIYPD